MKDFGYVTLDCRDGIHEACAYCNCHCHRVSGATYEVEYLGNSTIDEFYYLYDKHDIESPISGDVITLGKPL